MTTTYGKWTLIGESYRKGGHVFSRAVCGGCGSEHTVRMYNVWRGKSLQCAGCGRGPRTAAIRGCQLVTIGPVTKTLATWCRDNGHTVACYRQRLSSGMSHVEAITRPPVPRRGNEESAVLRELVIAIGCDTGDTLKATGAAVGQSRQNVEHTIRKALQRAQLSAVTLAVNSAMPTAPTGQVADLVAYAIEYRLGYALVAGDLSVMELREMFEKKLPFAS